MSSSKITSEKTSERGYFSLRYAIPGYTFILVFITINYVLLFEFPDLINSNETLELFLALVTLLTGSATGFLISQVYWLRVNRKRGILRIINEDVAQRIERILVDDHHYVPHENHSENHRRIGAILDCAIYLHGKDLLGYVGRRWDMYHLLSSTYYTLGIALIVGFAFRVVFEFSKLEIDLTIKSFLETVGNGLIFWENTEGIILFLILVGFIALLVVIWRTSRLVIDNFELSFEAIIRRSLQCYKDLEKDFPEFWFNNSE